MAQKEKSKVFPVSRQSRLKSATLNLKHYTFALKDLQQLDAACYVHVLCGPVLFIFVTKTFLWKTLTPHIKSKLTVTKGFTFHFSPVQSWWGDARAGRGRAARVFKIQNWDCETKDHQIKVHLEAFLYALFTWHLVNTVHNCCCCQQLHYANHCWFDHIAVWLNTQGWL